MRSAPEAVREAYRWTSNRKGMCLYTVQTWLGAPWSGPYAEDAWNRWGGHHPGDRNPPPGVPVYWHNPRSRYGHIALSIGGGRVRSTDWPRDTVVGDVSIDEMTRRWGLSYLGWSDHFSGGPIQGIGHSGGTAPAPTHGGDWFDMATKEELREVVREMLDAYAGAQPLPNSALGQVLAFLNGDAPNASFRGILDFYAGAVPNPRTVLAKIAAKVGA